MVMSKAPMKVKTDITSFYADTKSIGDRGEANVPGAR